MVQFYFSPVIVTFVLFPGSFNMRKWSFCVSFFPLKSSFRLSTNRQSGNSGMLTSNKKIQVSCQSMNRCRTAQLPAFSSGLAGEGCCMVPLSAEGGFNCYQCLMWSSAHVKCDCRFSRGREFTLCQETHCLLLLQQVRGAATLLRSQAFLALLFPFPPSFCLA